MEKFAQSMGIPAELWKYDDHTLSNSEYTSLEEEILKNNREYLSKIEMEGYIATNIDRGVGSEESEEHAEALKLFKRHQLRMDITNVNLRPWQKDLMDIFKEKFDSRKVLWINGNRGNEGKSWMQCYIESYYGRARVARLELRNTTSNTLYALSKQSLQTMDIFLFNDTQTSIHPINYSILEILKDGSAVSIKYNSQIINFKVPNIVMVF